MTRAFDKFQPGSELPLREFEKRFGIPAREGPQAWRSESAAVQNLLDHLYRCSRSYSSRQSYLRHLLQFSKWAGKEPDELAGLDKREAESLVQGFVDHLDRKNRARTYLNTVIKRLKTFYRTNGYRNQKELEIHHYHVPTRYRKTPEYIPGKTEIYSMANAAGGPRNRALILGLWSSGTRVNTFLALNYGDISKEIENQETHIKIPINPEMKDRVKNACKGGITYHTFISSQATKALKAYLRQRTEKHGPIQPDQPLFHSQWTMWSKKQKPYRRLDAKQVRKIIKKSARQAGIQQWKHVTPHCLRKAFQTILLNPTKNGDRLDKATQEFFMGHILPGTQDPYYDKTRTQQHREQYAQLNFAPQTPSQTTDKVVTIQELQKHLKQGWQYIDQINNQAIIRKTA